MTVERPLPTPESNTHRSRLRHIYISILLFIVALLPRIFGLDRFLTSDENTNIFFAGSNVIAAFLRGDFRGTYWHFYPGVTMSWLDAIGMAGQYGLERLTGQSPPPFIEYIYSDILSLVVANRLPYAILSALAIPTVYLLARKLLPELMALLAALFLAFDPFYLAHSRVAHGDMPVAVFMTLSALTFFIFVEREKDFASQRFNESFKRNISDPYLLFSAAFGSLAALTKAPGHFMAVFVAGLSLFYTVIQILRIRQNLRTTQYVLRIVRYWLTVVLIWGVISLFIFILLWPSMWVDPVGTMNQMLAETFGKVDEGHLVYFFGRATLDPGMWFYLYVIPFRLSPVVLIGGLLSLLFFIPIFSRTIQPLTRRTLFHLWLFAITLLLFGNLSPKKQDRYLLPLFPILDLLAAMGSVGIINLIIYWFSHKFQPKSKISSFILNPSSFILLILLIYIIPVFTYYPYYLTYFNPLMGGPTCAAETTLMGWGEGMEQVAAYLNTKPNAHQLYVASTPSQTLLPYFVGTGENFYTNDVALRADYVVLYLAQMQRLAPSPEIVHYLDAQEPEHTITIQGVTYAKIYPGPKFILTEIPPNAIPTNIGLADTIRLAGYNIEGNELTVYWHALIPPTEDYTISIRPRTVDGSWLAQQDSWPVNGLLPTSQWRQGDYVTDIHHLELTETDLAQIHDVEIVVYNLETDETLGPPIILPIKNE